jgi:hypothetical protein
MSLYSPRELLGFFLRALFRHQKTIRNREAAYLWYDGRR